MYIRACNGNHILIKNVEIENGESREQVLADLGSDPEINLFFAAEAGRRKDPELWEDVHDFHLLQALETFKRRTAGYKPALVMFSGRKPRENLE